VNGIIETISDKLGEYAVKNIIVKSAAGANTQKDEEFMSFDEVVEVLNEN